MADSMITFADAVPPEVRVLWKGFYKSLLALVVWREARGEGREGMRAVAHVIRNRVLATHLPDTWDDIIERKWQFSSMTAPGDAMLVQWPENRRDAESFGTALQVADLVFNDGWDTPDPDPTGGATLYCNLAVCHPTWADTSRRLCVIGHHTFFA